MFHAASGGEPAASVPDDMEIEVIYEDNHLLGVVKPAGMLVQGDKTGDVTLLETAKRYIKHEYSKPAEVFVGLVHRLDRPVSGVVLFARTSKAASRLVRAFRERRVEKEYLAIVEGFPEKPEGEIHSAIRRKGKRSSIRPLPSGRRDVPASLSYRVLAHMQGRSLLLVHPETGRHHQIRVQLSHMGTPVVGDLKYGARAPLPDRSIALHARRLVLDHPVTGRRLVLSAPPPPREPWLEFGEFY